MSIRNQICQILKEFWPDFNVSENDLKNPTQSFVMRFYEKFFEEFVLVQDLNEPIPTWNPEIKESIPTISYCVFLKNIFKLIKGPQFTLEDIIEPNAKRTSKLIEMLSNFLAYVDFYAGPHSNQVLADCDDNVSEKENFQKELNELNEKLNECAMNKAKHNSWIKESEENRMKLTPFYESMCTNKAEKEKEFAINQLSLSDQKDELKSLQELIQQEKLEIEELQNKIVASPDGVSRERAELIIKKGDLDSEHMCALNSAKEKNRVESCLDQQINVIQPSITQVKDLLSQLNFSKELETGLKIDEINWKKAKENLDAVFKELHIKEQEITHFEEEKIEFEKKCNESRYALEKSLEEVQRVKNERKEELNKQGSKQKLIAGEIIQIKDSIKHIEQQKEESIKDIDEIEQHIIEMVTSYRSQAILEAENIKKKNGY